MRRKNQHAVKLTFQTLILLLLATPAHASIFKGETLDAVGSSGLGWAIPWIPLLVVPAVAAGAIMLVVRWRARRDG